MKSKLLYQGISLLAAAAALIGASDTALAQQTRQKPNFVHIVADDLGWKDVGFNGCTDIKTPNIDALAARGAKFTQFYVQPMCTPTRAALMTGRYPFRYGLQTAVIPSVSAYGLDTDRMAHAAVPQGGGLQNGHHWQVASRPRRQEVLAQAARL